MRTRVSPRHEAGAAPIKRVRSGSMPNQSQYDLMIDAQAPHEVEQCPRSQELAPELGEVGLLEIGGVRRQRAEEPGLSKVVESQLSRPRQRGCGRLRRSCSSRPPALVPDAPIRGVERMLDVVEELVYFILVQVCWPSMP